ncbi:8925_t:CDS:2, partial [Funneliformis mosseae]
MKNISSFRNNGFQLCKILPSAKTIEHRNLGFRQQETIAKESTSPAKPKKVPNHPKYEDMIHEAIVALENRKGSSRQAIKKYIVNTYKLSDNINTNHRFRMAVNKDVKNGLFFFTKAPGPSGTIKLVKEVLIKEEKEEPEKMGKSSSFQY